MHKIATRGSRLAINQSGMIRDLLREKVGLECELEIVKTRGDIIKDTPLSQVSGAGFFTKEIERALLDGRTDIAVHSLKDLPIEQPNQLIVAAMPERENPSEVVITLPENIDDTKPLALKQGLSIGTSAIRRQAQIRSIRPDLEVRELRGNVTTRMEKVRSGEYDAVIIAQAGLLRVGVFPEGLEVRALKHEDFVPAPAQGVLAVETRSDDPIREKVARIDHPLTRQLAMAERSLLLLCGGGCHLPLGANIKKQDDVYTINVFWSYRLPNGLEKSLKFTHENNDIDQLVEESYIKIKQAHLSDLINFFGKNKKRSLKLLATRPQEKCSELADHLKNRSVEVIPYPVLRITEAYDEDKLKRVADRLDSYEYLIFSSANGVKIFANILEDNGYSADSLTGIKKASVGEKTALAIKETFGDENIVVSDIATGEGLGQFLADRKTAKALFPCAHEAGDEMEKILRAAGWEIDRFEIYETHPEDAQNLPDIDPQELDSILFTSALSVEYTLRNMKLPDDVVVLSIGPKTSARIEALGHRVDWEIPNSNLEWIWRVL